jgi:hypothetical protein
MALPMTTLVPLTFADTVTVKNRQAQILAWWNNSIAIADMLKT